MKSSKKEAAASQSNLAGYGGELLRLPLSVRLVRKNRWKPGNALPENVVDTHRLIFLADGELNYRVERASRRIKAPGVLYVPGWVRRSWQAMGRACTEMSWVEFSSDILEGNVDAPLFLKGRVPELDLRLIGDLLGLWKKQKDSAFRDAILEHQTKVLLARFFQRCGEKGFLKKSGVRMLPSGDEVQKLMDYLKAHFFEAGVLQVATAQADLSADYLRRLFHRRTGETMQIYVNRLRMRKARFLLNETTLRIKEVAQQSGFRDPLGFSKAYREFWGHPPSGERRKRG